MFSKRTGYGLAIALLALVALAGACKKRDECLPIITQQPRAVTIRKGQSATLTVVATVEGTIGYKWYMAGPTGASVTLDSVTNTITVAPDKTTTYFAWVYSICGEQRGQQITDAAVVRVE